MIKILITLFVSLLASTPTLASGTPHISIGQTVMVHPAVGPNLSPPALDNAGWTTVDWEWLTFRDPVWLRTVVNIPAGFTDSDHPVGLFLTSEASSEVWWDSKLLGHNGKPASSPELEQPGRLHAVFLLNSAQLQPGPHSLVMLLSRQQGGNNISTPIEQLYLGSWQNPLTGGVEYYLPGLISGGAVILACLFLLLTGWRGRNLAALWLAAACIGLILQLGCEVLRAFINYPYTWQGARLHAISASAWLFGFCLVGFLMARLRTPDMTRWHFGLGVLALLMFVFPGDAATILILGIFFGGGLLFVVLGLRQQQPDAAWLLAVLILLLALLALKATTFLDRWLYVGFALALILFFTDHVRVHFRVLQERDVARHGAARLELDLLKQHLKPHFLLNTLTALTEWVESSPPTAVRMIDALATEFRALIEVSNKPFITLEKELALCQTHLKIMSYRHDLEFSLKIGSDSVELLIPPMILHTLVENAVTHGERTTPDSELLFTTRQSATGKWRLRLDCPARANIPDQWQEGTGLAYVRARLVEAFGNDWQLTQGFSSDGGWFTELEIPEKTICA